MNVVLFKLDFLALSLPPSVGHLLCCFLALLPPYSAVQRSRDAQRPSWFRERH